MAKQNLLEVRDLAVFFPILSPLLKRKLGYHKAVNRASLSLAESETVGLVGESGCGKTTLGKSLLGLVPLRDGQVVYRGKRIDYKNPAQLSFIRREVQMIFQDPYSSLNPRHRIGSILTEVLRIHRVAGSPSAHRRRAEQVLAEVGLSSDSLNYYPHQFSGGQRQRISIARALILKPKVIIADEPVSALDVSIQAQIINLMAEIQLKHKIGYLFISHDLSVVKYLSHRVLVMYLGKIVEDATKDQLFNRPAHPYTLSLLKAVPRADPLHRQKMIALQGELPSSANLPSGCSFHPRCPKATGICVKEEPLLLPPTIAARRVACHHPND